MARALDAKTDTNQLKFGGRNRTWSRPRGPDNVSTVRLECSGQTIRRFDDGKLNAKIGEYCGLIHGKVPDGTSGLIVAHTLFKGLLRPRIDDGLDEDVYTYVMDHDRTFDYPAKRQVQR